MSGHPSRRTVVRSAAWSAPIIASASAVPAVAASTLGTITVWGADFWRYTNFGDNSGNGVAQMIPIPGDLTLADVHFAFDPVGFSLTSVRTQADVLGFTFTWGPGEMPTTCTFTISVAGYATTAPFAATFHN